MAAGEAGGRIRLPFGDDRITRRNRYVQIPPVKMELPELVPHVANELGRSLPGSSQQIQKEKIDENTIAFRQMMRKPDAAAFLPADQDLVFEHQLTDVFESDRTLIKLQTELRGDARDQETLRVGSRNRPAPTFVA